MSVIAVLILDIQYQQEHNNFDLHHVVSHYKNNFFMHHSDNGPNTKYTNSTHREQNLIDGKMDCLSEILRFPIINASENV